MKKLYASLSANINTTPNAGASYLLNKKQIVMKTLFTSVILLFILAGNSWGQTAASATWTLTSNANASVTGNVTGTAAIIAGVTATSTAFNTNGMGAYNWPTNDALSISKYYQVSISPVTWNNFNVSSISLYTFYGYTVSGYIMHASVYYSTDGFITSTLVGSQIIVPETTPARTTISGLNISVPSGKSLSWRIYFYGADGTSSTYYTRLNNMVITGTTTSLAGSNLTTTYSYTGSPQTFTVPNCVTSLTVETWGGGGGGFNGSKQGGGKGGGGGGYAKSTINNASGSYTLSVGGGGGEGANGTASTFDGTTVIADYGRGGTNATNAGGAGGTSNTGNVITSNGGTGGNGYDGTGLWAQDLGGGGGGAGGKDGVGRNGTAGNTINGQGGAGGAGDNSLGGAGGAGGNGGNGVNGTSNALGGGGGGGGDNGYNGGNGGFPGAGGGGGENGGGSGANGVILITYTLPNNPTITGLINPKVCYGATTADLTYSTTTGCADKYSIVYDATSKAAGFVDVTNVALSGSPIPLVVPAGATATSYNGTLTVKNSTYGFVSTGMAITVTVNPLPVTPTASDNSKTYTGIANATSISAIPGTNETIDWYVASLGGTALLAGSNSFTPTSPINANTYTYYAEARNTITGCVSAGRMAVTLTINKATPTATLAVNNSPLAYDGTAKSASIGISSSSVGGLVANILTGGAVSQTNIGNYAVIADFVPNDVTNYNTLTGLSAGNFVITPATSTTWTGASNTSWTDPGNWSPVLPGAGISVAIPNETNKPVISNFGNECAGLSLVTGSGLTIAFNGNLTVTGALNNAGGETDLAIKSTSAGTGSLITKGTVTGTTTVERYIDGASWGWHFLSSPIAAQAISPEFVALPIGTSEDFYSWSEPDQLWVNFKNATEAPTWNTINGSTNFIPGRGYLVAYQTTGTTKNFVGTLNTGPVSYTLTTGGTGANQYFNLVGNPYPCAIDWDAASGWGRGNLDGTEKSYWVWNDAAGNYGTYINNDPIGGTNDVTQYIASGQGFIVKASAAGDLTMNDDVKVHNAQPFLKKEKISNEVLRLKLNCNVNAYSDEAIVAFNNSLSDGGAQKFNSMYPTAPELWSVKNGNKFSINFMGDISSADIVPLTVKAGAAGTYTLTTSQVESFDGNSAISLEDRSTGTFTYLDTTPSYTFQVSAPATITNRFFLHFMDVTGVANPDVARNFNMYTTNGVLNIQSLHQQGGKIAVVDMLGRTVATGRVEAGATARIDMHGNTGVYIVSVLTGEGISNTKVLVK